MASMLVISARSKTELCVDVVTPVNIQGGVETSLVNALKDL